MWNGVSDNNGVPQDDYVIINTALGPLRVPRSSVIGTCWDRPTTTIIHQHNYYYGPTNNYYGPVYNNIYPNQTQSTDNHTAHSSSENQHQTQVSHTQPPEFYASHTQPSYGVISSCTDLSQTDRELWGKIEGAVDGYVSTRGRVSTSTGKIKALTCQKGYRTAHLNINGRKDNYLVHTLVAATFIKNDDPTNKTEIDHIDRDRSNNNVWNLRHVTRSENMRNAEKGQKSCKLTIRRISLDGQLVDEGSTKDYENKGYGYRGILRASDKNKPYRGFYWKRKKVDIHDTSRMRMLAHYCELVDKECCDVPPVEFREVPGYPLYLITQYGDIWSSIEAGDWLMSSAHSEYWNIGLMKERKTVPDSCNVHILVCMAFNGSPPREGMFVNHIDGNKLNPYSPNLEWVTPSGNSVHAIETGLCPNKCIQVCQFDSDRKFLRLFVTKTAAKEECRSLGHIWTKGEITLSINFTWAYKSKCIDNGDGTYSLPDDLSVFSTEDIRRDVEIIKSEDFLIYTGPKIENKGDDVGVNTKICAFHKNGDFAAIYKSNSDAAELLGVSRGTVSDTTNGKSMTCCGLILVQESKCEVIDGTYKIPPGMVKQEERICLFNPDGSYKWIFPSMTDAARTFNIAHGDIPHQTGSQSVSYHGYIFMRESRCTNNGDGTYSIKKSTKSTACNRAGVICMFDRNGNFEMCFNTSREAADYVGVKTSGSITQNIKGKTGLCAGHIFKRASSCTRNDDGTYTYTVPQE